MNSDIFFNSFNNQNNSIHQTADFSHSIPQSGTFQNVSSTNYINQEYPVTTYAQTNNNIQDNNTITSTNNNFGETVLNTIYQENNVSSQNFSNQYENIISNDYNYNTNIDANQAMI